MSEDEKLQKK